MQPIIIVIPVIDRSQIPAPEKNRGPLINWTQRRDSLIYQAEQKKIRPLGDGQAHRVAQLEAYIAHLRSLSWDGEGQAPELPDIPAYIPPPNEAAVPIPDSRDEELAALRARVAELEARDTSVFADAPLLPAPDALMSDYGPVGDEEAEAALTTDDLLAADDEAQTDVIGKLSRQRRKRFTELLNVELAELEQSRGGPREDRKREARIQRLLGVFARVGEM